MTLGIRKQTRYGTPLDRLAGAGAWRRWLRWDAGRKSASVSASGEGGPEAVNARSGATGGIEAHRGYLRIPGAAEVATLRNDQPAVEGYITRIFVKSGDHVAAGAAAAAD